MTHCSGGWYGDDEVSQTVSDRREALGMRHRYTSAESPG